MKKKNLILSILTAVLVFSSFTGFAQNPTDYSDAEDTYKVRPFRIGLKVGFPNLVGGNLEYVTPLFNDRLSVNADYSVIKAGWILEAEDSGEASDDKIDYTYLDLGLNYYFFQRGKGLYGGVSYSTTKVEAVLNYTDSADYIDEKHNSVNVKLGARLGGLFYFRPEIGYSFDPLPKKYDVRTVYDDGTVENSTHDWSDAEGPGDILFKGLMANIGFGFAF